VGAKKKKKKTSGGAMHPPKKTTLRGSRARKKNERGKSQHPRNGEADRRIARGKTQWQSHLGTYIEAAMKQDKWREGCGGARESTNLRQTIEQKGKRTQPTVNLVGRHGKKDAR